MSLNKGLCCRCNACASAAIPAAAAVAAAPSAPAALLLLRRTCRAPRARGRRRSVGAPHSRCKTHWLCASLNVASPLVSFVLCFGRSPLFLCVCLLGEGPKATRGLPQADQRPAACVSLLELSVHAIHHATAAARSSAVELHHHLGGNREILTYQHSRAPSSLRQDKKNEISIHLQLLKPPQCLQKVKTCT